MINRRIIYGIYGYMVNNDMYPLVMTTSLLLKMAQSKCPMKNCDLFYGYISVYQRVQGTGHVSTQALCF